MSDRPSVDRLLELQKLVLRLQAIKRIIYIPNQDSSENDVEHSYTLAMLAWYLADRLPEEKLEREKILRYALVHDLVEAYAGDTFTFASKNEREQKVVREAKARQRIIQEFDDWPELAQSLEDYEEQADSESRFVYAVDKIQPILMNYIEGGRIWREHGITLEQLLENKLGTTARYPAVKEYMEKLGQLLAKDKSKLFGKD